MKTYSEQVRIKANFSHAKVLVIEANDEQWALMKKALQARLRGVGLIRVATAEQALDSLAQWHHQEWDIPKLILMDVYLPAREDGWQLIRQIKALASPYNLIPIVVQSSSASGTDIMASYTLGISSYLMKPTDSAGWLRYVEQLRSYWWETVTLPPMQYGH